MKRSLTDVIGELLQEINANPELAPSRITSRVGISYDKLQPLLTAELAITQKINQKRRRLKLTEKGKQYLQHYKTLKQLTS